MLFTNFKQMIRLCESLIKIGVAFIIAWPTLCDCTATKRVTYVPVANLSNVHVLLDVTEPETCSFAEYLDKLGYLESRNRWHITNRFGATGRWQLTKIAHNDLVRYKGLTWSLQEIAKDSTKQIAVQHMLLERQQELLQHYDCYDAIGRKATYNDNTFTITEASLLAACHLGGVKSVKRWIDSNFTEAFEDANGVAISKYAYEFSDISLDTHKHPIHEYQTRH